jgi:hypothetical protein
MRRTRVLVRTAVMIGALAMAFPSVARAATITLSTDFQGSAETFVVAGQLGGFLIGSALASQTTGLDDLDTLTPFEVFCVDFHTDITLPATFDAVRDSMGNWADPAGLTATGSGERAAWLYQHILPTLDLVPEEQGLIEPSLQQRAALQIAIWNALYDSDFTVANNGATGNRTYLTSQVTTGTDGLIHSEVLRLANVYLGQLQTASPDALTAALSETSWLQLTSQDDDTRVQDVIGPAKSVPEPGSLLLLGTGLAALTAFRRKSLRG